MYKTKPASFSALVLTLCATHTLAAPAEQTAEFNYKPKFVASIGYTHGGDDIMKVHFERGSSEKITAGGEALLGAGALIPLTPSTDLQLTLNYHFDNATAKNGDISFTRYPLDALVFHHNDQHRFGLGVSMHLSPEIEVDIDGQGKQTVEFDQQLGYVLEYNFAASEKIWLGLRYTDIEYTVSSPDTGETVDGSHFGLMLHFLF